MELSKYTLTHIYIYIVSELFLYSLKDLTPFVNKIANNDNNNPDCENKRGRLVKGL